jgi:glucosamine--fructose-6-phosphate aminotransferase (isomerizing)
MCGIVGYIGPKKVVPVIIEGLRKLEYRGYDSAGIAVLDAAGKLEIRRASGKLRNLEEVIQKSPIDGTYGIGHTRWATHGRPTEENAHPHRDCSGQIVVVHNGIIENYLELKEQLQREGHKFATETDTEIVAHLVEKNLQFADGQIPLEEAVRKSLKQLRGIYALVFLSTSDPDKIVAARLGPPAVVGLGEGEYFVASDIPALLEHTRNMFFLADGDIAVLTKDGVRVMDHDGKTVERKPHHVAWDPIMAEKGATSTTCRRIFEQPRRTRHFLGRISQDTEKSILAKWDSPSSNFANSKMFASSRAAPAGMPP